MGKDTTGRPDSMLVEPQHIMAARQGVGEQGYPQSMETLASREPALAAYISESMAAVAGKLALSGAPTTLVQGLFSETMTLVLTSLEAQRQGHYDLWKGTIVGTHLEDLGAPPAKKPARPRRRKKGEDPQA